MLSDQLTENLTHFFINHIDVFLVMPVGYFRGVYDDFSMLNNIYQLVMLKIRGRSS